MINRFSSGQKSLIARSKLRLSCCFFIGLLMTIGSSNSGNDRAYGQQQLRQQYGSAAGTAAPATLVPRRPAPVESVHRPLTTWPNTVPVPLPPDAKFVAGYQSQYISTRSMTLLRFTTINPAATVQDWYMRSLQSAGWTVRESGAASGRAVQAISGSKNGISCSINVMGPVSAKDRTSVTISYNER